MRTRSISRSVVALCVVLLATVGHAQDAQPRLPDGVSDALKRMVDAQRSGDLDKYAATLASPVGPVFRLHADSAAKVGDAKRNLNKAIADKFGPQHGADPFNFAFDDWQLKVALKQLVNIQIDQAAPSGDNWKLQCTTTIRRPDGSTRSIAQGFLAVEDGADWKIEDLAIAGHLDAQRKGAETNWAVYRMFNTIADDVRAGKFDSPDKPVILAHIAYDKITGKDAAPPAGRDEYLAAEKAFNAGDFAQSLAMFKQSAGKGFPHAAFMVGYQYSLGEGTPVDMKAAVDWMKQDAARHDATALNFLGSMLLEGEGVAKNPAEGLRLLTAAAEQDNHAALLNLGRAYYFGLGVPKDPGKGMELFKRSADLGNDQAAYFVKWMAKSPGNRMFKDESQASAYQQIQLLRANALIAGQAHWSGDGVWHAADPNRVNELNAQADALAKANGLD